MCHIEILCITDEDLWQNIHENKYLGVGCLLQKVWEFGT